jgi:sugar (pentulose or hexulose) kinase
VGLGLLPTFDAAIDRMTHIGESFTPNQDAHHIYDDLYGNIYKKMYHQLQPLYEEIRHIYRNIHAPTSERII